MKKLALSTLLLFSFYTVAQNSKNIEKRLLKINALAPGISYEIRAGQDSSFNFDLLVGLEAEYDSRSGTTLELFPALGAEYKYYH